MLIPNMVLALAYVAAFWMKNGFKTDRTLQGTFDLVS